jgi:hypothetical protein
MKNTFKTLAVAILLATTTLFTSCTTSEYTKVVETSDSTKSDSISVMKVVDSATAAIKTDTTKVK